MIKAKTWKDDNWLLKLRCSGTPHRSSMIRISESNPKGWPSPSTKDIQPQKTLTSDNLDQFHKLFGHLVTIAYRDPKNISDPESEINIDRFEKGLRTLIDSISVRPGAESEAKYFYKNLLRMYFDGFKQSMREYLEKAVQVDLAALRKDDLHYVSDKRDPRDPETYNKLWYEPWCERLDRLYTELADKSLRSISANTHLIDDFPFKETFFDIRLEKNDNYSIRMNIKSDYGKNKFNKSVEDTAKVYECKNFVDTMSKSKGGEDNGGKKEISFCSRTRVRTFQEKVFKDVKPYFKPLSEKLYLRLKSGATTDVTYPDYAGAPAIEALRVGKFTADAYKEKLGGSIATGKVNGVKTICLRLEKTKEKITVDLAIKRWNRYYKADVVYVIDDPDTSYSDGTPAKLGLPIQVKYLNKSVLIGKRPLSTDAINFLLECYKDGGSNLQNLLKLLLFGDYILVTNDWNNYVYLPLALEDSHYDKSDPLLSQTAEGHGVEYVADVIIEGSKVKLRVPAHGREKGLVQLEALKEK